MNKLYSSPFRVYVLLAAAALFGILSGTKLPVSLFPNSSKPTIWIYIPYGNSTAEEFLNTFGKRLEDQFHSISNETVKVEKVEALYERHSVEYSVKFGWGVTTNNAKREVLNITNAFSSQLPEESRSSMEVNSWDKNSGFFALSFYSDIRSLDEVYTLLEPIITPRVAKVPDANNPRLYNPSSKEIRIELKPTAIAALQLFPRDVEYAVANSLGGRSAGSLTVGSNQFSIEMPRQVLRVEELGAIAIPTPSGRAVHLSDIARIDIAPKSNGARSFKTSGTPSIILFASPKPGGNVKQMAEDMLRVVEETMPSLPKDIQYQVLVDPSQFIRAAVNNVLHEVVIAALLAVCVLFLFLGSIRNVITAAIEIPLSMVLAFILMRFMGINLNLISLGGLALSAGMNVDASVVVMENIFRHFELNPGPHDFAKRVKILTAAVSEVQFAVIASTISSLVVFLPLTLTSDLSFALLGDLAFAVVFSHGFSAVVALLLVPTIRLHLMKNGENQQSHSPIEGFLKKLESGYANLLAKFLDHATLRNLTYLSLTLLLVSLSYFVIPKLPKEVVGKPDTDWIILGVNTDGNTLLRQMEAQAELTEQSLLKEFGAEIRYTFDQIQGPNEAYLMARLKDKSKMRDIWKAMEKRYTNTPEVRFWVAPWNPSELPIPNPPQLKVSIRAGDLSDRQLYARQVRDLLQEHKVFPRIDASPKVDLQRTIFLTPHLEQWTGIRNQGSRFTPSDLADLLRVATDGKRIAQFPIATELTDVMLHYPSAAVESVEQVGAFPIGVGSKIVPLKALAEVKLQEAPPDIFREDGKEVFYVEGRENTGDEALAPASVAKAQELINKWKASLPTTPGINDKPTPVVAFEEADKDLNDAIRQLTYAVILSILLILLTLMIQFGAFAEPLLVLVSIPLGFIGVLLSLYIFNSTLSLNSILGVILLNGIAVANSIILVDFIKRLVDAGKDPREAALEAARKRLRPILITSLTTILGMLPVALGSGDGGRILQPLGIAVSGGLWISMSLTLVLVPTLQVSYLNWARSPKRLKSLFRFNLARSQRAPTP